MSHTHDWCQCITFPSISRLSKAPHTCRTRVRKGGIGAFLFAAALAISPTFADSPAASAETTVEVSQVAGRNMSDPMFDYLWWIMFFIDCNTDDQTRSSISVTGAMTAIQLQYTLFGIPSDLGPDDRAALQQNVGSLYCALSTNPPAGVNVISLHLFMGTLKSMWIDLGGNPADLGC